MKGLYILTSARKALIVLGLLFLPTSCTSPDGKPTTIAGGAEGEVNYCVTLMDAKIFCVQADRTVGAVKDEDPETD